MNRLSVRLSLAFSLVIAAVLVLVGLALLVVLRNSPLVERQSTTALNEKARLILRRDTPTPEALQAGQDYVQRLADFYDVRVLLTTHAGQILADSTPGTVLNFANFRAARANAVIPGSLVGRARDDQRQTWIYLAYPAAPARRLILTVLMPRWAVWAFFVDNLLLPLLQAGGMAGVLAVLVAIGISRSIARPLQRMAEKAQAIARGDFNSTALTSGPDEVRDLGQSIDRMAQQVQASQNAQRDFLANASHELKTPLTSIQGFAQAMTDGTIDSLPGQQRAAGVIFAEAQRMRRMVDELLDLARLDASLQTLKREPVDLRQLVAAAVERFSLRARENRVTLTADLPPDWPTIVGDGDRLAQVFTNLLDNALKYTPAEGVIRVTGQVTPEKLCLTVSDTGTGIPPEDLPRIFERFYQVDKSRSRSGGLGLGLAITKEIVEAHGGRITAASQPGSGTQFVICWPAIRPASRPAAPRH